MDFIPTAAFRPFELLVNRGIDRSDTAQTMAAALAGRTLDVHPEPGIGSGPLRIAVTAGRVQLGRPDAAVPPDAVLTGSGLSLLRLMTGDPKPLIRDGHVQVTGNMEVAELFRDLLRMARPDLEAEISRVVGEPVAHELGRAAESFYGWMTRTADSVGRNIGDYMTEDRGTLPSRAEAEVFFASVDTLASDVERAEARLARLRSSTPGPDGQ